MIGTMIREDQLPTGPKESAAVEGRFQSRAKLGQGDSVFSTPEELAQREVWNARYRVALDPASPRRLEHTAELLLRHLEESAADTGRQQYSDIQLIPQHLELESRPEGHGHLIGALSETDPELNWANFTMMFNQEKQTELELALTIEQIMDEGATPALRRRVDKLAQSMLTVIDMYHQVHRSPDTGRFALQTARMWLAREEFTQVRLEDLTHAEAQMRANALRRKLEESCGHGPAGEEYPAHAVAYFATRREMNSYLERQRSHRPCGETGARTLVDEMTKLAYMAFLPTALASDKLQK